jgi:transcriptional regulator with XRE-family HTH domain
MATSFSERLKQLRLQKGLSQSELGNLAHVNYSYIGKYERGSANPSLETLVLLANCLSVTLDYLVNGNEDDVAIASLNDKELLQMFKDTENLDEKDKDVVKIFLSAFINNKKIKQLAS